MMKYVKLYGDASDVVEELSDEEAGRLIKAVLRYALTRDVVELPGAERIVFKVLLAQFERDQATYESVVDIRRTSGSKGGRERVARMANAASAKQKVANVKQNVAKSSKEEDKEKDKDQDEDKDCGVRRFAPPSPDEVRRYCAEKGLAVDPERFCDFYAAKGWRVGAQPMKDWRAAVRNWARRDTPKGGLTLAGTGLSAAAPAPDSYRLPDQLL